MVSLIIMLFIFVMCWSLLFFISVALLAMTPYDTMLPFWLE